MSKQSWKGSTLLNPEPPVLVSCGGLETPNLITIGWTGTICTQPSMVSISVRPERFSHHLIRESGQFAINLPTEALVRSVDWCGVKSGRDVDKFAACGLHAAPGTVLTDCPILEESPVNLECRVTQVIPLGSVVAGWASTICIVCFVGGVQLICLGVIGEYIGKIYMETKARPRYIISERTWAPYERKYHG